MQPLPQPIQINPKWVPGDLPDPGMFRFSLQLTAGEKKILRKKRPIACSVWVEKHRVINMGRIKGPWLNSTTPYLAGIMDASFFESVETITICAAPQVGKSECVNNCIGYAIDRRPGSVLYVYPDEQTARENSKDRIADMILTSPRLKGYLTGLDDDVSFYRINLQHMQIYMGWARSAARLANKPIQYVVFDETDKYPATAGPKETDPISLGEKRARTFIGMRKIWKISSPNVEDGPIWTALTKEASVIFDYWVKCPSCDGSQVMVFDKRHFKFPEDEHGPEKIKAEKLAWYECDLCHAKWNDEIRNEAVLGGEWLSRERGMKLEQYLYAYRPENIGFHIPSWLSRFVSLSEVAAKFLKGTKNKTILKDFRNNEEARPWRYDEKPRKEDEILALRDDRPRERVPGGGVVAGLVAGVDTQDYGLWYRIRAFGFKDKELLKESWGVREGFIPMIGSDQLSDFRALEKILWETKYYDLDGNTYPILITIQDALGHRTSEVYDFCRRNRNRVFPSFGQRTMALEHRWKNRDFYPGGKKPIPGGLRSILIHTHYYKNELSRLLMIAPGDPGAWHENSEFTQEYARHMTSEFVNEKGVWECPSGKENHLWDCAVLCLTAYDALKTMGYWIYPTHNLDVGVKKAGRKVRSKGISGGDRRGVRDYERPGWLKDR